ncbi:hypothetical protein FN846DRAFT_948744 [Sphaerosporella brunnea]|uniref:DUF962 domain protein n=1 Tax=Sphaerosporella brunnea TaxID=1250544 RepID=A0A5J5EY63_9PEZI|nr:hypothetical protein FN846DRAFT_948744 [Sphaerosporella brunnea]
MVFLDLEQHLVFYGTYHTHPKNVLIHIIFVPVLMFTLMSILANIPLSTSNVYLNASTLLSSIYAVLYILMEPVAGSLLAPYVVAQSLVGTYCVQRWDGGFNRLAAAVQVISWISQFVGHGVFERRAPALLDNLVQALFLAPLFVWLEVLFMLGYRPELKSRMEAKVRVARARLDAKKAGKES